MTPTALSAPRAKPDKPRRLKRPIRRRMGTMLGFLSLGAGAAVVVLVLAVGAYIFHDAYRATHQTTPTGAADAFLAGMLNERNINLTQNYMCDSQKLRTHVSKMIAQIKDYQSQGNQYFVTYHWSLKLRQKNSDSAMVLAEMHVQTTVNQSSVGAPAEQWRLGMRNESGWKVCTLATGG